MADDVRRSAGARDGVRRRGRRAPDTGFVRHASGQTATASTGAACGQDKTLADVLTKKNTIVRGVAAHYRPPIRRPVQYDRSGPLIVIGHGERAPRDAVPDSSKRRSATRHRVANELVNQSELASISRPVPSEYFDR